MTAHYAGDANHEASDGAAVAIVIDKATSTTTTVGDSPFTYDGTTHTGGSGTVTGAGGLSTGATSLTYRGDQINAGTYYVTAHYAGDANHEASDGAAVAIVINKATSTTTTVATGPLHLRRHHPHRRLGHGDRRGRPQHRRHLLTYTGDQVNAGTYYVTATTPATPTTTPATAPRWPSPSARRRRRRPRSATAVHLRRHDARRRLGHGDRGGRPQHRRHVADLHGRPGQRRHLYVTAHYAGDANHEASDGAAVPIVISKATSTTTIACPSSVTYTGAGTDTRARRAWLASVASTSRSR